MIREDKLKMFQKFVKAKFDEHQLWPKDSLKILLQTQS